MTCLPIQSVNNRISEVYWPAHGRMNTETHSLPPVASEIYLKGDLENNDLMDESASVCSSELKPIKSKYP